MFERFGDLATYPDAFWYATILALGIALAIIISLAIYIYFALTWYNIAKKVNHRRPWLAWIPFANVSLWLQMGGFHWAWVFLLLIPILGWIAVSILFIISNWRVLESLKYPGWLSLAPLLDLIGSGIGTIAYGVLMGVVAWGKKNSRSSAKAKRKVKRRKR